MFHLNSRQNDPQNGKHGIHLKNGVTDMLCSEDLNCGTKIRTRNSCLPSYSKCSNEFQQKQTCKCDKCPEAPYNWSAWGGCSKGCGCGVRYQYGTCPLYKVCRGPDRREETCNCHSCPVSTFLSY